MDYRPLDDPDDGSDGKPSPPVPVAANGRTAVKADEFAAGGLADVDVPGEATQGAVRDNGAGAAKPNAASNSSSGSGSNSSPNQSPSSRSRTQVPKSGAAPGGAAPPARANIIVIRRKKRGGHGAAHGGAWKIAYADFVTAMMAFFLLMWLLSSTNVGNLKGIADYFNRPLSAMFKDGPGAAATTSPQTDEEKEEQRRKEEAQQLQGLKAKLDTLIQKSPKLSAFKNQIKIDITSEGLRIQIIDDQNRPMFDKGDAVLKDYTKDILDQIGPALNGVPNHISIAGHTDALAYHGPKDGYSNWELSSERANSARRELLEGGMTASKVLQIRGLADALPFLKNDPKNPANRRISIVVLNAQAEAKFLTDGQQTPSEIPASGESPAPDASKPP